MDKGYKRINIMIHEDQYETLTKKDLNISGLVRDLLGDHLSGSTITLQVSEETRNLYETIVSNTGATDTDIEKPLRQALARVLEERIAAMQALHDKLVREAKPAAGP